MPFDHRAHVGLVAKFEVWAQLNANVLRRFYFHLQDTALGKFLVDNCFNPNLKCQNVNCKRSARDHVLSFVHKDGRVDITVGWLKFDLAAAALASAGEC